MISMKDMNDIIIYRSMNAMRRHFAVMTYDQLQKNNCMKSIIKLDVNPRTDDDASPMSS